MAVINKFKIIFYLGGVFIFFIGLIFIDIFLRNNKEEEKLDSIEIIVENNQKEEPKIENNLAGGSDVNLTLEEQTKKNERFNTNQDLNQIQRISRSFVERFGSFSNQSNFYNLESVLDLVTEAMSNWIKGVINNGRQKEFVEQNFYEITTKMISYQTIEINETSVDLLVTTQRKESMVGKEDRVYYQDIKLKLLKVETDWKVEKADWQPIKETN